MIYFAFWGVALVFAWLFGGYDGMRFGWMPLVAGLLFLLANLMEARFTIAARRLVVLGVGLAVWFVGAEYGAGAGAEWLLMLIVFVFYAKLLVGARLPTEYVINLLDSVSRQGSTRKVK